MMVLAVGLLYTQKASREIITGLTHTLNLLRGYNADALRPTYNGAAPVSLYVTFLRCPRCAYLSFVRGIRFGKTRASIRGTFHHVAFEYLMAREFRLACKFSLSVSDTDMMSELRDELQSIKRSLKGRFMTEFQLVGADYEAEWNLPESHLQEAYMLWLRRLRSSPLSRHLEGIELARAFVPFREFEVSLSAPVLGFSGGRIDVLEDGVPVEIKTGNPPGHGLLPCHELQLACYALLLEYCIGVDVDFGEIYYTCVNQRRRLAIDREKRLLARRVRDEALEAFGKAEPPEGFCRWCLPLSGGELNA